MSLKDLPPIREALEEYGLLAKKSFGQHFLLDLNITRKIARLAEVVEGQTVIEVGPGPGGLTRALLEAGAKVIAVEMDPRFFPLLNGLGDAAPGQLHLVQNDALRVKEADLIAEHAPGTQASVVANLPYNVGTALLLKWLTGPWQPRSMTLMFQKEVADRITAQVGDDAYGQFGIIDVEEQQVLFDKVKKHDEIGRVFRLRVVNQPNGAHHQETQHDMLHVLGQHGRQKVNTHGILYHTHDLVQHQPEMFCGGVF